MSLLFSNEKRKFIAFLKWEKEVHYFSQMGKEISLLFSKRKRYFILDFLDRKSPKSLMVTLALGLDRDMGFSRGHQGRQGHQRQYPIIET